MGLIDFLKAIAGVCDTAPLDPTRWRIEGDRVAFDLADAPALAEPGGGVYLKGPGLTRPVLVWRDDQNQLRAVVNRCTHGGRRLDPVDEGARLRCCSVNHSLFDSAGGKERGPAKGPLTPLDLSQEGDRVRVALP